MQNIRGITTVYMFLIWFC